MFYGLSVTETTIKVWAKVLANHLLSFIMICKFLCCAESCTWPIFTYLPTYLTKSYHFYPSFFFFNCLRKSKIVIDKYVFRFRKLPLNYKIGVSVLSPGISYLQKLMIIIRLIIIIKLIISDTGVASAAFGSSTDWSALQWRGGYWQL